MIVEGTRQMGTAPRSPRWRRSTFSSNGTDCVEVSHDLATIRDSKNPDGPTLRADLRQFLTILRHQPPRP